MFLSDPNQLCLYYFSSFVYVPFNPNRPTKFFFFFFLALSPKSTSSHTWCWYNPNQHQQNLNWAKQPKSTPSPLFQLINKQPNDQTTMDDNQMARGWKPSRWFKEMVVAAKQQNWEASLVARERKGWRKRPNSKRERKRPNGENHLAYSLSLSLSLSKSILLLDFAALIASIDSR